MKRNQRSRSYTMVNLRETNPRIQKVRGQNLFIIKFKISLILLYNDLQKVIVRHEIWQRCNIGLQYSLSAALFPKIWRWQEVSKLMIHLGIRLSHNELANMTNINWSKNIIFRILKLCNLRPECAHKHRGGENRAIERFLPMDHGQVTKDIDMKVSRQKIAHLREVVL